jgi:hypothetical protein
MPAGPRVKSQSIEGRDMSASGRPIRSRRRGFRSAGATDRAPEAALGGHVTHGHAGALAFFAGRV